MSFRNFNFSPALMAVLSAAAGLILFFNPFLTARRFCLVLGILFLVFGILHLVNSLNRPSGEPLERSLFIRALAELTAATLLMLGSRSVLNVVSIAAGLFFVVGGFFCLRAALDDRALGNRYWGLVLGVACAAITLGVLMMLFGVHIVGLVIRIVGLALLCYSGLLFWSLFKDVRF